MYKIRLKILIMYREVEQCGLAIYWKLRLSHKFTAVGYGQEIASGTNWAEDLKE